MMIVVHSASIAGAVKIICVTGLAVIAVAGLERNQEVVTLSIHALGMVARRITLNAFMARYGFSRKDA